jgi:hypothetical protein
LDLVYIPGGKARPEKQYFKYTKSLYLFKSKNILYANDKGMFHSHPQLRN